MPCYLKQPDSYSCGPVAIINALKWLGCKADKTLLPTLKQKCKTRDPKKNKLKGTRVSDLIRGINWCVKEFGLLRNAFGRFQQLTLRDIEEAIDAGHAVLVAASWRDPIFGIRENHGFLIVKRYKKGELDLPENISHNRFWVANGPETLLKHKVPNKLTTISRQYLRHICRHRSNGFAPCGWIIKKQPN